MVELKIKKRIKYDSKSGDFEDFLEKLKKDLCDRYGGKAVKRVDPATGDIYWVCIFEKPTFVGVCLEGEQLREIRMRKSKEGFSVDFVTAI
jgi:hypothetical protein